MSFGGHAQDMRNRYEENRAQMKALKERYNRIRDAYMGHVTYKKHHTKEKELSQEDLKQIKEQIRTKLKRDRIRTALLSTIFTAIISAIVLYYLYSKLFGSENLVSS